MVPTQSPTARPTRPPAPHPRTKKCGGPCGRKLPLPSYDIDKSRKDGRRNVCKVCRRQQTGPRGKEGRQAQELERVLRDLQETYTVPSLADVLTRAVEEVRQVGSGAASSAEQVRVVREAIFVNGCRTVEEIMEDKGLSRKLTDRALQKLVASKEVEPRDRYLHKVRGEAGDLGRPVTEYHPADSPRGEDFTHLIYSAAEDGLL